MNGQRIRIRLKAFDFRMLDQSATEIVETRTSNSRPGWGLISTLNTGTNQAGELVVSWISSAFVQRRTPA